LPAAARTAKNGRSPRWDPWKNLGPFEAEIDPNN
jgi:hypothetical protein